jgi:hypothetical protein
MRNLLDQLQKVRDELTKVAPGYDGKAGEVFAEIDTLENMIRAHEEVDYWNSTKEQPVDWTGQC